MKRCIAIVLAAAVMLFAFAGCSAKEVDLKAVLTEINTKCPDETAGLTELKDTDEQPNSHDLVDQVYISLSHYNLVCKEGYVPAAHYTEGNEDIVVPVDLGLNFFVSLYS